MESTQILKIVLIYSAWVNVLNYIQSLHVIHMMAQRIKYMILNK